MGRTDARSWRGPDAEKWTSGGGVSWNSAADAPVGGTTGQALDIVETATSMVAVDVTDWDQENTNDNHRAAVWVMEPPGTDHVRRARRSGGRPLA